MLTHHASHCTLHIEHTFLPISLCNTKSPATPSSRGAEPFLHCIHSWVCRRTTDAAGAIGDHGGCDTSSPFADLSLNIFICCCCCCAVAGAAASPDQVAAPGNHRRQLRLTPAPAALSGHRTCLSSQLRSTPPPLCFTYANFLKTLEQRRVVSFPLTVGGS